jgi:putative endonuclease
MNQQKKNGQLGEDLACRFVEELGYKILEKNWRYKKAEIDIIAFDVDILVFIEVKSRSYLYYGEPEESISTYKENLIIDAAHQYMEQVKHFWEIRFDIMSIVFDKKIGTSITHYKDAFYPGI